jgi:hypothetical protein
LRLEEENRLLKLQLAAAQVALAMCEKGGAGDLLQLEEEGAALGILGGLLLLSLASTIARACWFRFRITLYPPDRLVP